MFKTVIKKSRYFCNDNSALKPLHLCAFTYIFAEYINLV